MRALPLLETTDSADSLVFDRFFAAYERAFVLPDEMEDRAGFDTCLRLNHGLAHARLADRYGPFRELCVVARDPADGTIVGGANFIALPHPAHGGRRRVSANLNYVFVDEAVRGRGWFGRLLEALRVQIAALFTGTSDLRSDEVLIFIEQNDPLQMTPEAYARDSAHSGLDQFERLRIWAAKGARVVDFPYVQPPLSETQQADANLVYSVLGTASTHIDACLFERHLRSFFGVSVLKGRVLDEVPVAVAQVAEAGRRCRSAQPIGLLDLHDVLKRLSPADTAGLVCGQRRPLREWLRSY